MAVGHRTILSNVTISGVTYNGEVDLDDVFHARGTAALAANVGFYDDAGVDLSARYYPRTLGGTTLAVDTGYANDQGTDLRQIYAQKGTVSTGGGGGGGGGCLPFDTPVLLWAGGTKPLGELRPGDVLIGWTADGMIDESLEGWRDWSLPRGAERGGAFVPVDVICSMVSDYGWHFLINGELRATFEHTFLALRDGEWRWRRAEHLQAGDCFLSEDLGEVMIESVVRVDQPMRVANVNVEEVDNFLFVAFGELAILSHNPDDKS